MKINKTWMDSQMCETCGSSNLQKHGIIMDTKGNTKHRLKCLDCGHTHSVEYIDEGEYAYEGHDEYIS